MTDRKQKVILGDGVSGWANVLSEVPQGSVLGPLLFVIYINDLPENISNALKMYADDSKIIAVVNNLYDKARLQGDLDAVCNWVDLWLIKLSAGKCKVIHFDKKNQQYEYNNLLEMVKRILSWLSLLVKETWVL